MNNDNYRNKYQSRRIILIGREQSLLAMRAIESAPIDVDHPLEVVIREQVKARKIDQNALYWAGPLADISAQAWVSGRTYSAEVWHEYFKRLYLPEDYDTERCTDGYRKWAIGPDGERVMVGSTGGLTKRGFAEYLTQVEAHGASLGVVYHAK